MANTFHDQITGSDLHDNKVYPTTGTPLPTWTQTDARYTQQMRTIATSGPLIGGGNLPADRMLSIPAATSTSDGYLKATGWASFSSKGYKTSVVVGPSGTTGSDYTCTGTADNTVILTAYNALAAAGGGILFLRPGNFNIDAAMQFQYGNVSIIGSGQGVTTLTCRYDGSGGTQNSYYGMLAYWNSDNATPIHNVVIRDLSINLNGFSTNGIHFRATTSTAVASKKYLVENVDIYGRGSDATGSVGCIKITGSYSSVQGTFKRVTLRNVEIHDASVATSSTNPTGFSVLILSNDLSVFKMDNCYFHDTYGSTISMVSQTAITRKDWTFSNCSFVNTIRIYNGSALADIEDSNANGFNGIKIVNCTFDAAPSWSVTDDIYCLKIYDSTNFIVDHCVFNNPRAVIAVGLSPGTKESQSWTFSNNVIYNSLRFTDPDGHYAGTYSNNIFWKSQYTIFGGYGRHYPTLFHGNLLYNCGLNPQTDIIAHQSIISISDGGNIFQDNTFYSDIAAPNLLCVFAENSQGGSTAYHNVYKNNTFLGSQLPARIFGTDTGFKHTIVGNTGLTESTIKNSQSSGTAGDATLLPGDIVLNNFKSDGSPMTNPSPPSSQKLATKTTAYTLTATDSIILADATSGAFTITLPSAVGCQGRQYTIKKVDSSANTVTIASAAGNIDGTATKVLSAQWQAVRVVSDGINWFVV